MFTKYERYYVSEQSSFVRVLLYLILVGLRMRCDSINSLRTRYALLYSSMPRIASLCCGIGTTSVTGRMKETEGDLRTFVKRHSGGI